VIAALEEYQAALRAGHVPDRRAFLARHPDIAAALADCLGGLDLVRHAAAPLRSSDEGASVGTGASRGTLLGDYRILREVGRGGMGVVYEAVQESLGRHVALKVLPGHVLLAPAHLERFRREARAAALLHHSNIVPVFGVGCDRGVHFYAMQFIHGQSLDRVLLELRRRCPVAAAAVAGSGTPALGPADPAADLSAALAERLRAGGLPETEAPALGPVAGEGGPAVSSPAGPRAGGETHRAGPSGSDLPGQRGEYYRGVAWVGVQVAEALAYAHRQGILHRDVKPANLLLDAQGTVWVTDFGLAKAEGSGALTGAGDVVGTLRYLAPERFDGYSGPGSDIYSLGATLYELLTLRPAFDEPERARLVERVMRGTPPRPRQLDGRIPRDLETIVLKAMAREPADRYPAADALAEDLRRFLVDRPIRARRAGVVERAWRWCRRNQAVAVLLAASLVLAAGLAVLVLLLWDRQQQTAVALKQVDEQRREAERGRLLAESNFQRACAVLHNAPLRHQLEWLGKQGPAKVTQPTQRKALALYQGLLTEPGSDPGDRLLSAQLHIELGDLYVDLEQHAEATQEFHKAVVLLRPLVAEFPREAGFRDALAHSYRYLGWQVGWLLPYSEHLDGAEGNYAQAIALYEELRQEFQDVPWYRLQLAESWNQVGSLRRRNGRYRQAEKAVRKGLALYQQLHDEFPESPEMKACVAISHNDLAWVLAICPDRQPRDTAEALEHAQKAIALEPGHHDWRHTLGVVHCRLGHWKEALACIEQSRQLEQQQRYKPGPPGSFDRFFEAMAHSGLGEKEKARRCYDEGVRWMEGHLPDHPDLRRFRDEAAQMLGIRGGP
jgi:tetratricopeptide (TPR) repeat protein